MQITSKMQSVQVHLLLWKDLSGTYSRLPSLCEINFTAYNCILIYFISYWFLLYNQKKDWPLHKVECKSLVAIQPHSPSDTMRLVIRVLQRKKRRLKKKGSGEASSEVTSPLHGGEIDYLCSSEKSKVIITVS